MDSTQQTKISRRLRVGIFALTLAAILGGVAAAPARADDDNWRYQRQGWHDHEWREHEWREHHRRGYFYAQPSYYYATPPVYVAPPPAYYAPSRINLGGVITIR